MQKLSLQQMSTLTMDYRVIHLSSQVTWIFLEVAKRVPQPQNYLYGSSNPPQAEKDIEGK